MPTIPTGSPASALASRSRRARPGRWSSSPARCSCSCVLSAAVIDMSWYWTNNLRMQRAADAAALAGVVCLPGDPATAITAPGPRPPRTATPTASAASPSRRSRTRPTSPPQGHHHGPGRHVLRPGRRHHVVAGATRGRRRTTSCPCRWAARRTTTASATSIEPGHDDHDQHGHVEWHLRLQRWRRRPSGTRPGRPAAARWSRRQQQQQRLRTTSTTNAGPAVEHLRPAGGAGRATSGRRPCQGIQVRLSDAFVSGDLRQQHDPGRRCRGTTAPTGRRPPPRRPPADQHDHRRLHLGSTSTLAAWGGHTWVRRGPHQRQLPRPADRGQGLRDRRDPDPPRHARGPAWPSR